jgi:photosystem II PsbM protein
LYHLVKLYFHGSSLSLLSTVAQRVVESGFDFKKAAIAAIPAASIATPAFALDSIIEALPTQTLSLEVAFGAYLAVLLGTFLPALFLINLYIQSESRKAGKAGGQDSE